MNYTIKLAENVSWTDFEGQTVLFSKSSGDFFGLNPTATHLVQALLKSDFDATARQCAQEYGVEETQIRADLDEVVGQLLESNLISRQQVA